MAGTASSGGRNKLSRAEHELAGTLRTDRHGADGTEALPDPPKGRPTTPLELTGHALAEWTRMVDRLEANRTLSTVDDAALYQYCCLFGETEDVQEARRANTAHIETLEATIARHDVGSDDDRASMRVTALKLRQLDVKYTTQLRQGHMAVRAYLVEFGMTPSARARVKVSAPPAATDPMAEFDEKG
jgi:P27 family predicted phage terminase small subunit